MYFELTATLLGSPIVRAVAVDVGTAIASQAVQGLATSALKRRRPPDTVAAVAPVGQTGPVLRVLSSVQVVSAIPGRVRLRIGGLRGERERADQLTRRLLGLRGITAVCANPLTGTALVHFDPTVVGQIEIMQAAEAPAERSRQDRRSAARRSAPPASASA